MTYDDIQNSPNISSVDSKGYIRNDNNDSQSQTIVFADTDDNGKNENNTASLDWKYVFPVEDNPSEKKDRFHSVVDSNTASFSTNDAEIAQTISSNTNSLEVADVRNYSYEYIHNEVSGLVNANNDGSGIVNGIDLTDTFSANSQPNGREGKITINLTKDFNFYDQTFDKIYISKMAMLPFQILL